MRSRRCSRTRSSTGTRSACRRARRRCSGTASRPWSSSTSTRTRRASAATPTASTRSCHGRRVETSSPLAEGMKITMKLAEMLLYDVPNVKLDHVQIDVYTSFRDDSGTPSRAASSARRSSASRVEHIDWEETEPDDFVELNEGRFSTQFGDAAPGGALRVAGRDQPAGGAIREWRRYAGRRRRPRIAPPCQLRHLVAARFIAPG